ncbi:VanZ family protein [Halopseudomonas salegens]|uniref:VanZ like family protein n=1 Tax=Halopseudomonas salegens TaxID=1434072 RepID=A0A1H2FLX6_9GAMM|nr:VanZ family protein [Halopseudomonas salegens]SDU07958.1 VanZ like family protein [Halopseudomonas salegens]
MTLWLQLSRTLVRYHRLYQLLFFMTLGAALYFGLRPHHAPPSHSWIPLTLHVSGMWFITLLSFLAFPRGYWWLHGLLLGALGTGIEFGQSFQPSRTVDLYDIYANLAGVALGILLVGLLKGARKWLSSG